MFSQRLEQRPDHGRTKHITEMGNLMGATGIRRLLAGTFARVGQCGRAALETALARNSHREDHRDRGDVPGWVMITLMSAVLVAALLALAGPALEGLFNQAMDTVAK